MKYIFLIALCVVAASATVCPPDACMNVDCPAVENCADGRMGKDTCLCCDICVKYLKEGEHCFPFELPPTSECGPGLVCNGRTMTCIKLLTLKTCEQQKSEAERSHFRGRFIPSCEPDGSFCPNQCHRSVCRCSTADGVFIPGYKSPIYESHEMNCNCARDQFEYLKLDIIGKMFFCEPNGNYGKIQCSGSSCYCVNGDGNQVGPSINIGETKYLNCEIELRRHISTTDNVVIN